MQLKYQNHQRGAVLVTALMLLIILTLLGLTTMTTTTQEERMASNLQDMNRAFLAADAGISIMMNDTDTLNTAARHTGSKTISDYDAAISYTADYRQQVPMGRSRIAGQIWEVGKYSKYYFDLRSQGKTFASTDAGTVTTVTGGAFQISPKSN